MPTDDERKLPKIGFIPTHIRATYIQKSIPADTSPKKAKETNIFM